MFIKQLYHYNKYGLAVFLFFLLFFFYINYKWGLVATPVYQYGMFSGSYSVKDTQQVYEIYVDGKLLEPATLHFTRRDMLFTLIEKYERQKKDPLVLYQTMQQIFGRAGAGNMVSSEKYLPAISDEKFAQWLLGYIGKGSSIAVMERQYQWQDNAMQPVSPLKPTGIAANR
ncbi:MAG: hypothetical protein QM687_12200 [Ferruginibacter sp.]